MMKQYAVKVTDEALEEIISKMSCFHPAMRKGSIGVLQKRY